MGQNKPEMSQENCDKKRKVNVEEKVSQEMDAFLRLTRRKSPVCVLFRVAFIEVVSGYKTAFVAFIHFLVVIQLNMMSAFLVAFLLGLGKVAGSKECPPLTSPQHGTVTCLWANKKVSCGLNLPDGAVAEFTCLEFYKVSADKRITCRPNGRWSSSAPQCVPDCGRRSKSVSLIVNGLVASHGAFPWHVAIYNSIDGRYEYWCGGSLISNTAVITAAHCAWKTPPETLMLVFGKFHRDYDYPEKTTQKIKAKKIEVLASYQDVSGNYNGDVALIFLERPVTLGHYSAPICIDWDQRLMEKHLIEGSQGVVLGWGLTENETLSDLLRVVRLPVISDEKCIAEQESDFKKFVTYTSFCAGFTNGTGVCNGDSGGGLIFFDEISSRWYLQGLVSVSPRRKGTPYCDPNYYTVFTKVGVFSKWLKTVSELENESRNKNFWKKYFGNDGYYLNEGRFFYPISEKMLELSKNYKN